MCNREIKNPDSIERKMGLTCYKRYMRLVGAKYRQLKLFYYKTEETNKDDV